MLTSLTLEGVNMNAAPDGTTIVRNREDAERVMGILRELPAGRFHACDTEVIDLRLDSQSPVGNGVVTCMSIFSGPDVDFGNGPRLWIDNLDDAEVGSCVGETAQHVVGCRRAHFTHCDHYVCNTWTCASIRPTQGTLECFREFLEDENVLKVRGATAAVGQLRKGVG